MTNRLKLLLAFLIVAVAAVYLIGNGSVSLWDRDEPRYAQTSRQMLQSGDWVVPRFLDKDRTAKPALIYWCQAAAMKVFGDNEFAARFPSSVAITLLLVVLACVLCKPIGPERTAWTVFIFATSGLTIASAKMCITDAVLLLWITIAQLCLYAIWRGNRSWSVVVIFSVMVGLAGLTKGPVIMGMQVMTLAVLGLIRLIENFARPGGRIDQKDGPVGNNFLVEHNPSQLESEASDESAVLSYESPRVAQQPSFTSSRLVQLLLRLLVGAAIATAVVLPWVLMVNHRAPAFIGTGVKHDVWDRMMTPLEQHVGPPGYYLLTIWVTYFPWSLLLPMAIGVAVRRRADPKTRFALAAIIGPWLMLECVRTKLPHYLLPVFPPLAFLTADALVSVIHYQLEDLRSRVFVAVAAVWCVAVAAVASGPWLVARAGVALPYPAMTIVSVAGVLFGAAVFVCFARRRIAAAAVSMGLGTLVVVGLVYGLFLPRADFLRVSPRVAKILIDHGVTQPHQVLMMDYMEPSLAFAQGGTIREAGPLGFSLKFEPQFTPWLVVTKTIWDKAPAELRGRFDVVGDVFGLAYADKGKWVHVLVIHHHA